MASWVTHLMVADRVLEKMALLCRHEFCVGNIAPDCNVENEDWTQFTPSREVTHWMTAGRKVAADCDRFYEEYGMFLCRATEMVIEAILKRWE